MNPPVPAVVLMKHHTIGPVHRVARRGGFTLIEVLVALTIVAVALMAALRATGSMAQSSEELRLRTLAQWSAENQLAELRIQSLVPGLGAQTKVCPQADIELTCKIEVFAMPAQAFRRVEVSVFGGRDNHRLARLVGFPSQLGQ